MGSLVLVFGETTEIDPVNSNECSNYKEESQHRARISPTLLSETMVKHLTYPHIDGVTGKRKAGGARGPSHSHKTPEDQIFK